MAESEFKSDFYKFLDKVFLSKPDDSKLEEHVAALEASIEGLTERANNNDLSDAERNQAIEDLKAASLALVTKLAESSPEQPTE